MKGFLIAVLLVAAGVGVALWQHWLAAPAAMVNLLPTPAMYKWHDAAGHWVYGDKAPPGVTATRVEGGSVTVLPSLTPDDASGKK